MMDSIAVIGYSGRFPGARDTGALWTNLRAGTESISFFTRDELFAAGVDPALVANPSYVPAAAVLDDVESFDAAFFGYSPAEAEVMDPQQRVFLEIAHAALEHSGYEPRAFDGRIGVYAGAGMNTYLLRNLIAHPELLERIGPYQALIGSDKDFLATRVSYKLNLRGPSVSVQTACSTSLVAVTMACQSLMNAECDLALAGGVTVRVPQRSGYLYQEEGILSPDGHCRPFDAAGRGTVPGSGAGVVVLKRLSDAVRDRDHIHAVVRGWATNNDGAQKAGFTAPSVEGQTEAVVEAMAVADVDPATIQYIETHGTGTHLGDPIEMRALARAFAGVPPRSCAIGSVKSNFGHLDGAAGVTGLIKTILSLQHRELPPTLHFQTPNPQLDLDATPFYVNDALREWKSDGQPRRAGVSSFGIGGTNAHVVVEEAPQVARKNEGPSDALFVFSAKSESALETLRSAGVPPAVVAASRAATPGGRRDAAGPAGEDAGAPLHDVAYTLQVGRYAHPYRKALVVDCGAGSSSLYDTYPVFREAFDRSHDHRAALAALWQSLGLQPAGDVTDVPSFLAAVGEAWEQGANVDWEALHRPHERGRVPLPTYPFERTRHWIEPSRKNVEKRPNADEWLYVQTWKRTAPVSGDADEAWEVLFPDDAASLVAAVRELRGENIRLAVVTTNVCDVTGAEPLDPERAAIAGVCKVIPQEYPHITCRLIDFDGYDESLLHRELHSGATDPVVAYRHTHRWTQTFENVGRASARPPARHVLITGAHGRFGRAAMAHFACPVTAIDLADGIDVTSREQMRAAIDAARKQHGPIDVVLHAAGTTEGVYQPLSDAGPADFDRHLRPKLEGARILDELLRDDPPRIAVITSSLASILGGITLGPYAAADAACDAFAQRARLPWMSVSFEGWEERGPLMLKPEEMMAALDRVLAVEGLRHVIVSTADLHTRMTAPHVNVGRASARPGRAEARPAFGIEATIAQIWQETLGVEAVGADDDFFDLGGDSLIGLQILSRLRAEFHVELPLRSFFEARTVAGMARTIEGEVAAGDDEAARMNAILAEIEALSDDEVEAQLRPEEEEEAHACRGMRFSLFFFSADGSGASGGGKYDLLLDAARFADARGFDAVWTPERHFVDFGGLYPNPSVLGAALAMATQRVQIRAGSVVLPLHHPIRIAEEWAVVDNLSRGRVAISCATGWHPEDFVMAPEQYASRREVMFRSMNEVRRLWRGETVTFRGVDGKDVEVRTFPRPLQRELSMWVTSSGNADTWVRAGESGANVLATMGNQSLDELAEKVRRYRDARRRAGFDPGVVSLMLHTFVGIDDEEVRRTVRGPMADYLFSHMQQRDSFVQLDGIRDEDKRALTEMAFEHYFAEASLLGTPEKCSRMVGRLERIGVDEIACLVDFGVDAPSVLGSLELLDEVRRMHAMAIVAEEVAR